MIGIINFNALISSFAVCRSRNLSNRTKPNIFRVSYTKPKRILSHFQTKPNQKLLAFHETFRGDYRRPISVVMPSPSLYRCLLAGTGRTSRSLPGSSNAGLHQRAARALIARNLATTFAPFFCFTFPFSYSAGTKNVFPLICMAVVGLGVSAAVKTHVTPTVKLFFRVL